MRKILFGLSVSLAMLASMASLSFANGDILGDNRFPVWRSSQTCNAFAWGVLSTSATIVHAISVDSPTVNIAQSYVATFNSTAAPYGLNAPRFLSTGTLTNANILSAVSGVVSLTPNQYDAYFSSGAIVNKVGASCTTVWWDFVNPKAIDQSFFQKNYPWNP